MADKMTIEAVCSPDTFPIAEPADVELRVQCSNAIAAGDKLEVQFPSSWLMVNGPSFTRQLQTEHPDRQHHISVSAPGVSAEFAVEITHRHLSFAEGGCRHGRLITATLARGSVPANSTIVLNYANTLAPYIAEQETVWVRVNGEAPHTAPSLITTPGEAVAVRVIAPSSAVPGQPFDVLIVSLDKFDNCSRIRFEGQALSTSDGTVIKDDLSFTGSVRVPVTIGEEGVYRFRLGNTLSNAVHVAKDARRVYWGDLHIHTKLSHDGMGCDPYGYARDVSGLDFAAACDHVESLGTEGYEQLIEWAADAYEPGKFASMLADERIPPITGHHNVYFRCVDAFLGEASWEGKRAIMGELNPERAMLIPHHTGITFGDLRAKGGGVDLSVWDDKGVRPVMEIYSHHGQSELYSPQHALAYEFNRMRNPERRANTSIPGPHYAQDYWKAGYRLGVIGSSDEHSGQGGRRNGGVAAVLADELTRESIFDSIRTRQCYATTGERILLDFRINGSPMGSELRAKHGDSASIGLNVWATEILLRVEILRFRFGIDSEFRPILSSSPRPESTDAEFRLDDKIEGPCMYYARITQEPLTRPGMAWTSPIWIDTE